jgi:uncharacterized LabA/DUF88 family protein
MKKMAILLDGDFFLKRYRSIMGLKSKKANDPEHIVDNAYNCLLKHLNIKQKDGYRVNWELYRIFYYDCLPLKNRVHNPVSKKVIDYSKTDLAILKNGIIDNFRKKRKVALRLGDLKATNAWSIKPIKVKELFKGSIKLSDLNENDVKQDIRQKGIDMRIGIDIASLAYKKLVDAIVLVSGDSDFVPAAKVARREGVDFILDPMWSNISNELYEHIDGLTSVFPKPHSNKQPKC